MERAHQHHVVTMTSIETIIMRNSTHASQSRRLRSRAQRGAVGLAALAITLSGCSTDRILAVTDPDVARPTSLVGVTALPALRAGAIGDFGTAYNGGNADEEQVQLSGLVSDELINTETFPTRIEIDQRQMQLNNGSLSGTYYDLQRARVSSERAVASYKLYAKTSSDSSGVGEVLALGGMSYIFFAENYCGAVPMSSQNADGTFTYGSSLSTKQMLDSAISKFTQALATNPPTTIKNLALVGQGRALLDEGQYAAAAAAVAGVPVTFQYLYQHSITTNTQNNGTWSLVVSVGRFGEANVDGGNGLPFRTDGDIKGNKFFDPRVVDTVANRRGSGNKGFDNSTVQWVSEKYPNRDSPIVVSDGVEAQLITAEATLAAGNAAGALTILNGLRTNAGLLALRGYTVPLPLLTLQASTGAQVDQLFKERAYWLYLTSHRLGDLRRLVTQYNRGSESVFPTGPYPKGGSYGTDVNVPVPQNEQNNPMYHAADCKQNVA